jgi:hypothetical protein
MKKGLLIALLATSIGTASAQKTPWVNHVKLSGYGIGQYTATFKDEANSNSFNLRIARFSLDGRIMGDWYWKAQIQFNGNTSTLGSSPKVVDMFIEWQKYDYFRVKLGQFKNPFTYENPMNPIDQGFMGYGQVVQALAGFSDRAGTHSSNGRDIGIQAQGDFLKNANGRNLLHYQVGVFNGQGINVKDIDQQKNLIGGFWVMPVKGMRLGAFGWTGSYARKGFWTDGENPNPKVDESSKAKIRKLQQRRYAFSAEYLVNDWTFRTEYAHSTGNAFAKSLVNANYATSTDCNLGTKGNKAQGIYALVIAPIIKDKFHAKVRYDMYESDATRATQKTQYEFGLDYMLSKNLKISGEYAHIHDRSALATEPNSDVIDIELGFKF